MAVGTEFRSTAHGIQQALGPDVANVTDKLDGRVTAEVLDSAPIRSSRTGRAEALRIQGPSLTMALALGAAVMVTGLTIVGKAPVGPMEKHTNLALAVTLLEMATLIFMWLEATLLVPKATPLLGWAKIRVPLAHRMIVEIKARGLLLGLMKSLSVPVMQSVFRLIPTLDGALDRNGARPLLLRSAIAMPVAEARF